MRVLLVEPDYKSKFPPLGLLKIGTYHKNQGDYVRFVREMIKDDFSWDRIYITTMFSFHHDKVVKTIRHYKELLGNPRQIFVGGGYATLNPDTIYESTGVYPFIGRIDFPNALKLGEKDATVDSLIPDYDLLHNVDYDYGLKDCYFGYATRGCNRHCHFCAVGKLEPKFEHYTGLKNYIEKIIVRFGERQNMILMDNNVLMSNQFERIINDLIELNFAKNAKFNGKNRYVDFNQGLDARLVTKEKAGLLAKICLKPVRLAYDKRSQNKVFNHAVINLAEAGFRDFSTYILYNFDDTPEDFYERIAHCNDLNNELGIRIYSFPMRYTPLDQHDRNHVGKNWYKKQISGLFKILNVTRGTVSPGNDFF
jgi:hypothetical protein